MDRWFDELVLSAEVGIMKPDPEIYLVASTRLRVDPAHCLFVGDGGDDELIGARSAGMHPIRYDRARDSDDPGTPSIASHEELLDLLTTLGDPPPTG